jgi:putative glutamine amidotransferase
MTSPVIGITVYQKKIPDHSSTWLALPEHYVKAVVQAGGLPLLVPIGLDERRLALLFNILDGILLSGGGDVHPKRYGALSNHALIDIDEQRDQTELPLARWAVEKGKPLLAICRGLQVLNVALGGTLVQDIPTQLPGAVVHKLADPDGENLRHEVLIRDDTRLRSLIGKPKIEANSFHHQAILELADRLTIAATTADDLVEAVELSDHPFVLGVQWHPERLPAASESQAIFKALIHAALEERTARHG